MIKSYYFTSSLFLVVLASIVSAVSLANTKGNALQPVMQKPISGSVFSSKNSAYFEENKGQFSSAARYVSRTGGYQMYLTDSDALIVLEADSSFFGEPDSKISRTVELRHRLLGATNVSSPEAIDQLPGHSNYFVGQHKDWRRAVRHYRAVRYAQVYPGIDMVYYSRGSDLEYDFVVSPGASPQRIRYVIDGSEDVLVDASGNLVVKTAYGDLRHHAPYSYQDINGQRVEVASQFHLDENDVVSFELAAYDARYPLIIDPVLSYSGYLGGTGDDVAYDVAADSQGNFYVTGQTTSGITGSSEVQGDHDAFVSKFSKDGVLRSTSYIGTENLLYSEYEVGRAIAVDNFGKVYVTGAIAHNLGAVFEKIPSEDPSVNPSGAYDDCDNGVFDVFIAVLSSDLDLNYFTCVGGSAGDMGEDIIVDASGDIYVAGWTASTQFPVEKQFQSDLGLLGGRDAFVLKLSPDAQASNDLMFSSYLGGENKDQGFSIALDAANNIYVVGNTSSPDLPGSPEPIGALSSSLSDGFVAKINGADFSLVYTRYLGVKNARGVVVDSGGDLYVTGQSEGDHAYVMKLDGTTTNLVHYTVNPMLIGGDSGVTEGVALAIDSTDSVYLVGTTQAIDLMGQNVVAGNEYSGGSDAFLARLDSQGSVRYSVYLGGASNDRGRGVARDGLGNVYVVGETDSLDFPVYQAQPDQSSNQSSGSGSLDAFLARIGPYNDMSVSITDDGPITVGETLTYSLTVTNFGPDTASGIKLVDTLPSGVIFQGYQFQAGQGVCSQVMGIVDCILNDMVSGQVVMLDVLVAVSMDAALSSEVEVSADQFDFVLSNNNTSVETGPASSAPLITINDTGEAATENASSADPQSEGGGALGGLLVLLFFSCFQRQKMRLNRCVFNG